MTFKEFAKGEWCDNNKGCEYSLYMVKDGNDALYIGISHDHIYNRWFNPGRAHMPGLRYKISDWCFSTIGRRIADNRPESEQYTIGLFTLDEVRELLQTEIKELNLYSPAMDLEYCEELLIAKMEPFDNTTCNPRPRCWQGIVNLETTASDFIPF